MKNLLLLILALCSFALKAQQYSKEFFSINNDLKWQLLFNDSCTHNWENQWFLDGLRAEVKNTTDGMVFTAGPIAYDDACHAVLWTRKSFTGDVKIEYEYTRTDAQTKMVNIIYIQATGKGVSPYTKDISEWNHLRIIPSMKTYFNTMNALHISYAAFGQTNNDKTQDYIRARKYPKVEGEDFNKTTEIIPSYFNTELFKPGITYKITVIKSKDLLFFNVEDKNNSQCYFWQLKPQQLVNEGRIGLRHMYTRSARYKNFKVYTR